MPQPYDPRLDSDNSWFTSENSFSRIMGFSFLASIFGTDSGSTGQGKSYLMNSVRLFLLGTIIEGGRRLFGWLMDRFKPFQYSISAHFTEGDPAHEWITLFLTEERIWDRSRKFQVNSRSSIRQWTVDIQPKHIDDYSDEHTEFVPMYDAPQLFQWKGYLVEVQKGGNNQRNAVPHGFPWDVNEQISGNKLAVTIYTRDMSVMAALVEEARRRYVKISQPHVIIHSAGQSRYNGGAAWGSAKRKARRPLSSVILQEGVIKSLVDDAREFFKSEAWYRKAGIPHHRGYLLHGPPGTGKSSTIYAVAAELEMEIYSISLSSNNIDDGFLERAVALIPKYSILLIEDIDCAFPSRENEEEDDPNPFGMPGMVTTVMRNGLRFTPKSQVTLSGLLNVLDGVGSEEGKIFFATTNYVDRLDPALLRPGRIDKKLQYKLATQAQAAALFMRFYPDSLADLPENVDSPSTTNSEKGEDLEVDLLQMSKQFAASIPQHEFSTAEIQGFLLSCKHEPLRAVQEIGTWVENEKADKEATLKREAERKEIALAKKARNKSHRDPIDKEMVKPETLVMNGSAVPKAPTPPPMTANVNSVGDS